MAKWNISSNWPDRQKSYILKPQSCSADRTPRTAQDKAISNWTKTVNKASDTRSTPIIIVLLKLIFLYVQISTHSIFISFILSSSIQNALLLHVLMHFYNKYSERPPIWSKSLWTKIGSIGLENNYKIHIVYIKKESIKQL